MIGRTYVEFELKALYDGLIKLTSDNGSTFLVVLGAGYDNYCQIKDEQGTVRADINSGCLDENQYIRFKLSWKCSDLIVERAAPGEAYSRWMTLHEWRTCCGPKNTGCPFKNITSSCILCAFATIP